jgi:hypothetical protein
MPRTIARLEHRFVKFIPEALEDGVLYVSVEYKTVTHRCCCGCGEKVVTPLSPAGWALTFNGQSVSLSPSIGGGTCNSHYFVRRGRVEWVRPLTKVQAAAALRRDHAAAERVYRGESVPSANVDAETSTPWRIGWWRHLWSRRRGDR